MSTNGIRRKVKRLVSAPGLLILLPFPPEKSTSGPSSPCVPGAWTSSRLSHWVELDQVSGPAV